MSSDTDRPFDADEADVIEQQKPIINDHDDVALELPLLDADRADALDQYLTVPIDDDDWRTEPNP